MHLEKHNSLSFGVIDFSLFVIPRNFEIVGMEKAKRGRFKN